MHLLLLWRLVLSAEPVQGLVVVPEMMERRVVFRLTSAQGRKQREELGGQTAERFSCHLKTHQPPPARTHTHTRFYWMELNLKHSSSSVFFKYFCQIDLMKGVRIREMSLCFVTFCDIKRTKCSAAGLWFVVGQ